MMMCEALEKLLSAASIPDAHRSVELLLSKYHTLDGILCADVHDLVAIVGERAAMLVKLAAATVYRRAEDNLGVGVRYNDSTIREYLVDFFCGSSVEMLYLISLGESDDILSIDLIGEGTVNGANVTSRRLLDAAVRSRAKAVVIAHNHPAGRATPSSEDMLFTDSVENLFREIGIKLYAHYIIAGNQCKKIN